LKKVSNILNILLSSIDFRSLEWWLTPIIPATWEVDIGGSKFEASLDKTKLVRLHLKNKLGAGGVAQEAEHLPLKCEALSSSPRFWTGSHPSKQAIIALKFFVIKFLYSRCLSITEKLKEKVKSIDTNY
jgi:hypothetical protein